MFRDSEVEHLDQRLSDRWRRDTDVLRLQIAVDDPGRVRVNERIADLQGAAEHLLDVEALSLPQDGREIDAFEVLHDDIWSTRGERAHVQDTSEVRAVKPRDRPRLAEHP